MSLAANRKASLVLAVALVVFLTFLLSGYVLVKLNLKKASDPRTIYSTDILDGVYAREVQIVFFVDEVVKFLPADSLKSKGEFISALDIEVRKQQDSNGALVIPELVQINSQLKEENVKIKDGKISIKLNFIIEQKLVDKGDEIFSVSYKSSREFSREIS